MASVSIPSSLPPEVLNSICHAILRPQRQEGLATLASLARTCRLFHEPAVNAIWRSVPNILTLIHTLPGDLWLESRVNVILENRLFRCFRTRLSFKRPPVQSDFSRLKHYAHRIKHVLHANSCLIPPDILSALAIHFPAGALLPNMRSLRYRHLLPPPSEPNHSLQVLFGPKLDSLQIICSTSGQAGVELSADAESFDCIRALPSMCPNISSLNLRMDPNPKLPLVTGMLVEMIPAFQNLTHLLVGRILLDFPAIVHLARLQSLEVLKACISDKITQSDIQCLTSTSSSKQSCFPSLEKISLDHRALSLFTSLLKVISSPDLDEVTLSTSKDSEFVCTSEDVSELFIELSRHSALTRIIVLVESPVTGPRFDSTTFKPLLMLPHIRVLDIDIAHPLDINDELIAYMAFIWCSLIRLSLCVTRPPPGPLSQLDNSAFYPTATLFGLTSFTLWCPELEWLGLPLNMDLWREPYALCRLESRPGHGEGLSEMSVLDVGLSVVYDPVSVVAFLSDMFPGLDAVRTAWRRVREEDMDVDLVEHLGRPSEIVARWEQVADLADGFKTVRRQERTWKKAHDKSELVEDAS